MRVLTYWYVVHLALCRSGQTGANSQQLLFSAAQLLHKRPPCPGRRHRERQMSYARVIPDDMATNFLVSSFSTGGEGAGPKLSSFCRICSVRMAESNFGLGFVCRRPQMVGSGKIRHPRVVVLCRALPWPEFDDFRHDPSCQQCGEFDEGLFLTLNILF